MASLHVAQDIKNLFFFSSSSETAGPRRPRFLLSLRSTPRFRFLVLLCRALGPRVVVPSSATHPRPPLAHPSKSVTRFAPLPVSSFS